MSLEIDMHPMQGAGIAGILFILAAWGVWWLVRRWDRTNAVVAAAPPLPIKFVNVHDDVWVRGDLDCSHPIRVPHFGHESVHYSYKLEEYVRKTRTRNGKTETYYEWETRQTKDASAPFRVVQGEHSLAIRPDEASFQYLPSQSETIGSWRHSCTLLPYPGPASAVGVVDEDKRTLVAFRHVPLIVTPLERPEYLEHAEAAERWGYRGGLVLLFLGAAVLAFSQVRYQQEPVIRNQAKFDWWNHSAGLVGGLVGAAAVAVFWMIRTYNSLVICRTRADEAWSQIDVQLQQRYDLIPNLVEVVKGYAGHERQTLEKLTALRTEAASGGREVRVAAETGLVQGLTQLAAVAEAYPDLKANEQFRRLAQEMTALEEKIAHARGFFNDSVKEYNLHTAVFPANLVAALCRFQPYPLFDAELGAASAPQFKL